MEKLNKTNVRKRALESDNSNYFSDWGSRKPLITIREEIDNIISAKPYRAGMVIRNGIDKSTIETFNDGMVPSPERMEGMYEIGKTHSSKNGASICGVGQIEGLVAGRKSPTSCGTLTFKSIFKGQESCFVCRANGKTYTIETENSGPFASDEQNLVEKRYEGMAEIDDKKFNEIEALTAVKIYPYQAQNPNFVYTLNDKKIEPISVLYEGVTDKLIKRFSKEYVISYHDREYIVKVNAADVSKYVKPDGFHIDTSHANMWDKIHNLSTDSTGVFVELGGVNVITGGRKSWNFIRTKKAHSTENGIYVCISIPVDGELKEVIFAESANKSEVSMCLCEIKDHDGTVVFKEMISDINEIIGEWTKSTNKKEQEDDEKDEKFKEVFCNEEFVVLLNKALDKLTEEQLFILEAKKFKTIKREIENKVSEQCYSDAV